MAAPVVIDMGIAEPTEVMVASMVGACAKAVGDGGECHLVRDAPQGEYRAIAILTWEGADKVRIEVGLRRDDGTEWRVRSLSFQPEDVEIERFRSVGFVVGTLATEEEEQAPAPPVVEPPKPPAPPPPETRPVPLPPPAPEPVRPVRRTSSVGLVGTIGGALDQGAPRYGGALRGRFGFASWLAVATSVGASFRPRDQRELALRFLDAGLGLAFILHPPDPVGAELSVEAVLEHFRAEANDALGAEHARERLMPAARIELDGVWAVAPPVDIVLGGNLFLRPASTAVTVGGESAGSTGEIELGAAAGARLSF